MGCESDSEKLPWHVELELRGRTLLSLLLLAPPVSEATAPDARADVFTCSVLLLPAAAAHRTPRARHVSRAAAVPACSDGGRARISAGRHDKAGKLADVGVASGAGAVASGASTAAVIVSCGALSSALAAATSARATPSRLHVARTRLPAYRETTIGLSDPMSTYGK